MFTNDKDHAHEKIGERKNVNFSKEAEERIEELINLDVNRKNIRKDLEEKNLFDKDDFPNIDSLNNKIKNITKQMKRTQTKITVDEFKALVEEKDKVPDDKHEAFIVDSKLEEDENGGLSKFVVIMSTRSLVNKYLEEGSERWMLALDATYQTNMEECPVIIFGKTGSDGKFHAVGFALTKKEDKESYKFVLDWISRTSKKQPGCVMADGNTAITAAILSTFPNATRMMCFTHVVRNTSQRISNDIRSLQQGALDQESFQVLYGLLQRKWTEEVMITTEDLKVKICEFFLYFTKTWCLSETSKWYQACNPQHATPSMQPPTIVLKVQIIPSRETSH